MFSSPNPNTFHSTSAPGHHQRLTPSVASLFNSFPQAPQTMHQPQQHFSHFPPPPQHQPINQSFDENAPGMPLLNRHSTYVVDETHLSSHKPLTSDFGAFPRSFDSRTRRIIVAASHFLAYTVANGHIRVIALLAGKPGLLKGHTGKVLDMEINPVVGDDGVVLMASVSDAGELIVWKLSQVDADVRVSSPLKLTHTLKSGNAHYNLIHWIDADTLVASNADELVVVSVSEALAHSANQPNMLIDLTSPHQASKFVRSISQLSNIVDFSLSLDRQQIVIAQSNGTITINDLKSGAHLRTIKAAGATLERVIHCANSFSTHSSSNAGSFLLTAGRSLNELKLLRGDNYTVVSSLVLHPVGSLHVTAVDVDPSGSFVVVSYEPIDANQTFAAGFLTIHLRRSVNDVRFDYVSQFHSNQPILSFSLSVENNDSAEWDAGTAASIAMYACTTKPIVMYHVLADKVAQHVFAGQLKEDQAEPEGHPIPHVFSPIHRVSPDAEEPGLLTPQALGMAPPSSKPSPSSSLSSTAVLSESVSIKPISSSSQAGSRTTSPPPAAAVLPSATAHPPAATIKILQRPPAINSAVLSTSAGSPSSSPTTSHAQAAMMLSPNTSSPDPSARTQAASAQTAEGQQTPAASVPSTASVAASSNGRPKKAAVQTQVMKPQAQKPQPTGPLAVTILPSANSSAPAVTGESSAASSSVSEANEGGDEDSKESRQAKQENNLIARLDKLFSRNFVKVGAMVKADSDRERQERAQSEKARVDAMVKAVSTSINQSMEATMIKAIHKSLPTIVDKALKDSAGAYGGASVDADAVSASVVAALKAPLSDAFKTNFTSVLLPGFEASTRAMLKQIENVVTKMSESSSQSVNQAAVDLNAETALLQSTNATLNQTIATMREQLAAQTALMSQMKDFMAHSMAQPQAVHAPHSNPMSGASSPTGGSGLAEVKQEITGLLARGLNEQAFYRALSFGKLPVLVWLCQQLDPRSLNTPAGSLSSPLTLSLIQQLGFNLRDDSAVKLAWLRECSMALDRNEPSIAQHVPNVMREVLHRVDEQWFAQWQDQHHPLHELARTVRSFLQMMSNA